MSDHTLSTIATSLIKVQKTELARAGRMKGSVLCFFIGSVSGTPAGTSFDINSVNFGKINTAFDPRIIQFVGRFEF